MLHGHIALIKLNGSNILKVKMLMTFQFYEQANRAVCI